MNRLLLASAALVVACGAVAARCAAQSCQSQSSLDAYAASIMQTVQSDGDPECVMNGNGNCVPVTLQPGDVTPNNGQSVTDKFGNAWALQINPQGESNQGNWYGNVVYNGGLLPGNDHNGGLSYAAAIRLGPDGLVYIERSKGAGWQVEPSEPGAQQNYNYNTWSYVSPPSGAGCGGTVSAQENAAPAPLAASASPASQSTGSPTNGFTCSMPPGMAGPGSGSVTDASGNVFTVDQATNNQVMVNGQPATPNGEGSETSAVTEVNGQIVGQDENTHQWFVLVQDPSRPYWQPVAQSPQQAQQAQQPLIMSGQLPPAATAEGAAVISTLQGLQQQIEDDCQAALQRLSGYRGSVSALEAAQQAQRPTSPPATQP